MRPITEVVAWYQESGLDVKLYSDGDGGFIRGDLGDQEAREAIAAARVWETEADEDDQDEADAWDRAVIRRGHIRTVPCLPGCDEHTPGNGWHVHRSRPGRGAFLATEVTL